MGIVVFGAVPAAVAVSAADPFGPPEVADAVFHPATFFTEVSPFAGADGNGNMLLGSLYRDKSSDDQMAVYERCGTAPVTWTRTVLTDVDVGVTPNALLVARDGTAMASWRVAGSGTVRHYSATRPPGGAWGTPQLIVQDPDVNLVQLAISDSGDAVAAYADSTTALVVKTRPAGGDWSAPETISATPFFIDVAMSATGDAVVVYRGPTPGWVYARYRPAGGAWGAQQEVLRNGYQNTLKALMVEFDGTGKAVALANFRELADTIRVNVRTAAGWGPTDQVLDDDGDNPPNPFYDLRLLQGLVRHPEGMVAVWLRRPTSSNFTDEIVISRLGAGGWETPATIFDVPTAFTKASVATNDAGEILLAATLVYRPTTTDVTDVRMSIAASLTAPWPDLTRLSPTANPTNQYRDAFAVGGGQAFSVGWGVHGGSNQRTEVVSTKPAGAACGSTAPPTPTPTPTATATPEPLPLPSPTATPTATPTPGPATPAPPSAIADFTTLPKASTCIRGRKLTVKLKKPPKGYVVKTVTVKVNAKKVATLKGSQLKKPLYLRKLPTRPFTVTVSITLTKGKGLRERRRYVPCT